MTKRVSIHGGLPKTGTSSIQEFLRKNEEELRRNRCSYALAGRQFNAHHPIASLFLGHEKAWVDPCEADDIRARMRGELASDEYDTVIISSEVFYYANRLDELREFFADCDLQFVLFLRRQDEWLESVYRQDLKVGESDLDVESFLERRSGEGDYLHRVEKWSAAIGRENVRLELFRPAAAGIPLQQRFLEACGVAWSERYEVTPPSNLALNQDCLEFLRFVPDRPRYGSRYVDLMDLLVQYTSEHADDMATSKVFSPQQRIGILEKFKDSNAKLAERYFGRYDGKLFDQPEPDPEELWRAYPGLSPRKAAEIAYFVISRYGVVEKPV